MLRNARSSNQRLRSARSRWEIALAVVIAGIIVGVFIGVRSAGTPARDSATGSAAVLAAAQPSSPPVDATTTTEPVKFPPQISSNPAQDYPAAWSASISQVGAQADFGVYVPNATAGTQDEVSNSRLLGSYIDPNGDTVVLAYPIPAEEASSSEGLTQGYLSITEHPWGSTPAGTVIDGRVNNTVIAGFEKCTIDDGPALCVPSRLPGALGQSNPADLMFDLSGTSVELTGGSSLDDLTQLASDLTSASDSRQ
jgi:hypothetical protein